MTGDSQVSSKFLQKLAEKRAAEQAAKQAQQNDLLQYSDLVPDIELNSPGLSDVEMEFDKFISLIPITEAYQKWGGKSQIPNPNKEEIKVRCPNPNHEDKEPSFVMNTVKQCFNCFKCGGGDLYDIAAWYFGFPVPGYKDKAYFRDLKDNILTSYGFQMHTAPGAEPTVIKVEVFEPEPPASVSYTPQGAAYADPSLEQEVNARRQHDSIDWRAIVPENTFMRAYLEATTTDACPEEFHFWMSLVATGLAAGRHRQLIEEPSVKGNLFVCLTGPTGTGKSRAKAHLRRLIEQNLAFDKDEAVPLGVKIMSNAQSGEIIVKKFQHEIIDPATGKSTGVLLPVKTLIDSEEMAGIAVRANRSGSVIKDILQQVYDCSNTLGSEGMTHDLTAVMPFGCLITTTQNKSIRDVMNKSDTESGFANRWIFATGVAKPEIPINFNRVDLMRAGGLIRILKNDCMQPADVIWSQDGAKQYTDLYFSVVAKHKNREDTKLLQRLDLTMKKLILLFTINNREKIATLDTVNRVSTLLPYLIESYGIIDEQISATEYGDNESFILRTIRRLSQNGRHPTASEIWRAAKHKIPNTDQLKRMLTTLVEIGEVQHMKVPAAGGRAGRPKDVYMVHSVE